MHRRTHHTDRRQADPGKRREPGDGPALNLLLLSALPLVVWALHGSQSVQAAALLQGLLLLGGLRLVARGQELQADYAAGRSLHPPRIPRKFLGSVMIGVMVFLLAGFRFDTLLLPMAFGCLAFALALAAFGADPLRARRDERGGEIPLRRARVLRDIEKALEHAEKRLAGFGDAPLSEAAARFGDGVVTALHDASASDRTELERMHPRLTRLVSILEEAIDDYAVGPQDDYARARFLAKLDVMHDAVTEWTVDHRRDRPALRRAQDDRGASASELAA